MTQLDAHIEMRNFIYCAENTRDFSHERFNDCFLTSTLQHDLSQDFLDNKLSRFTHTDNTVKEVSFSAYHVGAADDLIKYDSETATSAVEKSTVHFHFQVCFLKEFFSWRWIVHEQINGNSYLRVPDEEYFQDLAMMFRLCDQKKLKV